MKRQLICTPEQVYRNRDYVSHLLDDNFFDAINKNDFYLCLTGCLDAIDAIPAGSMRSVGISFGYAYYGQSYIERGRTLAELQELESFILGIDF